ncbi:unnamed protein product [Cuscuta epithymum]|uniref:Retrotransposon Copia-like N-terminal domain-containing protein n=1 Tax=Cuscuta epithymum TaxID=186058 RepID=A0AAV0EM74_9ASTE|nr:unnamed protein product [Cuscuta epithymum]CAH9124873.1 unnamed protein product [Cuscuta epithymum]
MVLNADSTVVSITASTHFPIKLTSSNYPVWKSQVFAALIGLGLEEYVDGTLTPPARHLGADKSTLNPVYQTWYRQDKTILSALLGSCSDNIQPIISSASTAKEAWDRLSQIYAGLSRGRIMSLKSTFAKTVKGTKSITEYLAEMQGLADALALSQNPMPEEDLVIGILNGLGQEYSDIFAAVRVRETPLPLTTLQDILLEHEAKQAAVNSTSPPLLPTANYTSGQRGNRDLPGQRDGENQGVRRGGFSGQCCRGRGSYAPGGGRGSYRQLQCHFCDNIGHDVKNCRKL